ncbi:MAG: diguanylate cyclase [Betaproteobacteria bacterium]|nr:diguanylate cyclase [Betaproteobacteria bacterium]
MGLRRTARVVLGAVFALVLPAVASATPEASFEMTRHPLEARALRDPQGVLDELPPLIAKARAANDTRELALLHLAESNACRVNANWLCQSEAGMRARAAAAAAGLPQLEVRGLILESRGRMALQDFSRAAQILGEADKLLQKHPNAEARADVYLAYSSLSYAIGKHAKAAEYAGRGLESLGTMAAPLVRIRLMRNQARAMAQLDDTAGAHEVLRQAIALAKGVQDPKLQAELHLEDARVARLTGDVPTQVANGRRVLELAKQLANSQLFGQGHEVLGLAAFNRGDSAAAERDLRTALRSFRELKQERDERRVLRALVRSLLGRGAPRADLEELVARSLALETSLEADDRNMAADDVEARLKFAQQELELQRLEAAAILAAQEARGLADRQRLTQVAALLALVLLGVVGVLLALQHRFNSRLKAANALLAESELRYRMLAEHSRDMVVRMLPTGKRLYVSPASRDLLGMDPSEFVEPRWDLVHPDDRERLRDALRAMAETGGASTVVYRARHADGHYIWIEAAGRLVPAPDGGSTPEIVYSGRDVSARVEAEQALAERERFMRGVTDNIPAMIAHIDHDERYTFANAYICQMFGVQREDMIGRTVREVRGETRYAQLKPHIDAVLDGARVTFEWTVVGEDHTRQFKATYVPDIDASGTVRGFFAVIFDISELKEAQAKLDSLARTDSLTGLANRRAFEEGLGEALARSRRNGAPLAMLVFDIDRFKEINDRRGHLAGDAVIVAFARRLQACVRQVDLVARLGGDEFVLLMENPSPGSGEAVAGKLLAAMSLPLALDFGVLPVTTSIGVAYGTGDLSATELLQRADRALYAAKEAGRNTFRVG